MKLVKSTLAHSYELGFYCTNWGYPIAKQYELGINLIKWQFGIELFNDKQRH